MKQNLSSKWTLPSKLFNLAMWLVPLAGFARASATMVQLPALSELILPLILLAAWCLFLMFVNHRLKFAAMDDQYLYVARWFKEHKIPLNEIESVSLTTIGFVWVRVRFKNETVFGKQIFFMPILVREFLSSFCRFHPVVGTLKTAAAIN